VKKSSPGLYTGLTLGGLCLIVGLGLYLWAPDFTGFFNRAGAQPALPVWTLLLLLALVNFIYAGISYYLQRKIDKISQEEKKPENRI
jgi:hypothetical protein